jgi:HD superfamily phosphohydrolase
MTEVIAGDDAARDRDDVGRILSALVGTDEDPEAAARKLFATKRTKNRDAVPVRTDIPDLALAARAVVAAGGGGVVIQCVHLREPRVTYALKVLRPSLLAEMPALASAQRSERREFLKHAPLSHRNVARVFGVGKLEMELPTGATILIRPILMEWIEKPRPLCEYLAEEVTDWRVVVDLVAQALDGIQHIHDAKLIHWDLKSDNLLVDTHGVVRVSDLGSARRTDSEEDPTAFSTRWNLPEALGVKGATTGESSGTARRTSVNVPDRAWDTPWLDLWMLARDLNRVFAADGTLLEKDDRTRDPAVGKYVPWRETLLTSVFRSDDDDARYALAYVRLVLRRLLLPTTPRDQRFYETAADVAADLRKLTHGLGAARNLPELAEVPQHVLRVPVWGNIPYTPRVAAFYNSRMIRRLSNHLQLGGLVHVYPGASHRRSEHAAGVYAATLGFVRALYASRHNPFWRLSVDEDDLNALLVAALAHDIGHIAFGHFIEEMAGLMKGHFHEDYVATLLAADEPTSPHPELLADYAELRTIAAQWCGSREVQGFLNHVAAILRGIHTAKAVMDEQAVLRRRDSDNIKVGILHSILDSAIDADKLDYLARDAHHCNVQYAKGVDVERFFQSVTVLHHIPEEVVTRITVDRRLDRDRVAEAPQPSACVAVTDKGIAPVESILVARYHMFSVVYWHHTARAQTAMLQFVVQEWVGAKRTKWDVRLRHLVTQFRERSDRDALRWLKQQVEDRSVVGSDALRGTLSSMCDALLGDRNGLYWPAFELQYGPSQDDARSLAGGLMAAADRLDLATGFEYVEGKRGMRRELATYLRQELQDAVAFAPGDLLVDVPPAGKDQVDNVFVVGDDVRQVQDVSPLALAVRDAFRFWVRRLRVFLSPAVWDRCTRAGLSPQVVRSACWRALLPQRQMFAQVAAAAAPRRPRVRTK